MVITWRIINLEWIDSINGNDKVVKNVHYWVDAVDGDNMGYTWGNVQLNIDSITSFSGFDELTEAQVIDWVKSELDTLYNGDGVSAMEQSAITMCNEADPTRKRGFGVPW